uniref:Uncharacterized protein n=1 Tax=Arundo donax TaxID=35708 RepID=A0A0A9B399_ARUDO
MEESRVCGSLVTK